jgi:tetratricopeptide (TPR) repeat protein
MAFVYGLATANNWALIGYFPLALLAVILLKRMDFLNGTFFLKMLGAGLAGLALYLLLPALALRYDHEAITFWTVLKTNLVNQKQMLFNPMFRFPFLILGFGSALLPLVLVGIRWPASLGDVNPISNLLVQLLFRMVHAGFFAVGLVLAYRPAFIEEQFTGLGLPYLTMIYLGALCVGYFAGYLLLVFGVEPARAWQRPGLLVRALNYSVVGVTALSLLAMPALLVYKNLPRIKAMNSPALQQFSARLAQSLPNEEVVMLSDQPWQLWLVAAWQAKQNSPLKHLPLHTQGLTSRLYHQYLAAHYPNLWKPLELSPNGQPVPEPVNPLLLIGRLASLAENKRIFYLHPSFGYYFEVFQPRPHGLAMELVRAGREEVTFVRLGTNEIQQGLNFWANLEPDLALLGQLDKEKMAEGTVVSGLISQSLNQWAVYLQRSGRWPEAATAFKKALALNPDNLSAQINLAFNQRQQKQPVATNDLAKAVKMLGYYSSWEQILGSYHPFDDPDYLLPLGQLFADQGLNRQALQNLHRAREFRPNDIQVEALLGQTYLQAGKLEQVFAMVESVRKNRTPEWQNLTNQLEWVRLEAMAYYARTNPAAAEAVLQKAMADNPSHPLPLAMAVNVYLTRGLATNALAAIERQLRLEPANLSAQLNQGIVLMQLKRYLDAVTPLTKVLEKEPKLLSARMNRAIAYLQAGKLDEAGRDYEAMRQTHPNYFAVYYGLGEIAFRKQKKNAAIENYESYLKHAPKGTQERAAIEERLKQLKGK